VWTDPSTGTYVPDSDLLSPAPVEMDELTSGMEDVDKDAAPEPLDMPSNEQMKPTLGFLPPPAIRSVRMRPRKSKGKKSILRGAGVDGG